MNSFTQLSGGGNTKFLLRWRGKQEGPYTASVIETKLATNEIGLLHELLYGDKWVTIRDYITERDEVLRAEREAQEGKERRESEEAERQAKEQDNQRQTDLLAEERRRLAQLESLQAHSQDKNPHIQPLTSADKGSSGLRSFGILLLIAGLAVTGFFFLAFDTSVESGSGRVVNLGLMADRQNGIIVGVGIAIVGALMLVFGSRSKN